MTGFDSTYGEYIAYHTNHDGVLEPEAKRLVDAIEADKKQAVINERLHPLNQYPYKTMRTIDPSA